MEEIRNCIRGIETMQKKKSFYEKYIKRLIDIVCASVALIVFWWLYLIVAILVRINLGSPIIFKQPRPGKDEKIFCMYKFRSMTDAKDQNGNLLPDEVRLTKFGRVLRATSMDELPELINILKGDMSIIGPRPLLSRDVAYMNSEQRRRHIVRPGLTGLAQCSGRNGLNWDEKLQTDIRYVDNISLKMDLYVFFQTIYKVLKRENIAFEEGEDMDLKDWNELKRKRGDE